MKIIWIITIIIIGILCQYRCQKMPVYSPEVEFLYKEAQGTIAVKCTGYGKTKIEAINDAQKSAFKTIMLYGLPGTELSVPLLESGNKSERTTSKYLSDFFDQNRHVNFIMSVEESSEVKRVKGGKKITLFIKINYNSLRKDLEQNQIIRKFGY